jgi:ectoine hydroxylase-related dioxygenase (phytanoyl-CoA dioxygenase family)
MKKTLCEVNGFDVNSVKSVYLDHGCAVIRDVFESTKMSKLQTETENYFHYLERLIKQNAPEIERNPGLAEMVKRGTINIGLLSDHIYDDASELLKTMARFSKDSVLTEILSSIFDAPPILLSNFSTMRFKDPMKENSFLPFHQDATPEGPSVAMPTVVTCFTPLCQTGKDRPGIELLPIFLDRLIKLADDPKTQFEALELNEKNFEKDWKSQLIAPELNPGDIVLFNGLTVHRSQPAPRSWKPRASFDLRFVSVKNVPTKYHGHTGIDINKQKVVDLPIKESFFGRLLGKVK